MTIKEYIAELNQQFQTGLAREHAYRPALKDLLQSLLPTMIVTNEPARQECGAPDFIITRHDNIPSFFVEAKDIGDGDLDGNRQHKEQFTRYKQSLDNIIFTDYLDFHLYSAGQWVQNVRIGEVQGDKIVMHKQAEELFINMIEHTAEAHIQTITSAGKLAEVMASKAKLLSEVVRKVLEGSDANDEYYQLQGQYHAFKDFLISDLSHADFADMYAQTIAYGLFAARLHDKTPEDFTRTEAATLIPKSNPFLRQIFQSIAGLDIDDRIVWIVDDLVAAFAATDVRKIMGGYTSNDLHNDPMIHFYEEFLAAYDPKTRKSKGVWYTPQPVVSFIVHAVDSILQKEFKLPLGLADYSKIARQVSVEQSTDGRTTDGKKHIDQQFHRVQILDPATGTGTFLAEVIKVIHNKFKQQQGMWQGYVENHLIPRLNGFEILMASYAMAHLKLDMMLESTGYEHNNNKRLHIYLTNSLEETTHEERNIWAQWLSAEAAQANRIKRDTPVMVMIGNPPYSGESQNKGRWISQMLNSYKKEPGGVKPLKERNPKWLNDDYVKFIRLAQDYIERNENGVIGFINPHGYLDNPTFRGMRWNLLKAFDKVYTINLHGNAKKKEQCPDGSKDENIFDIMQGVSINLFIKTNKKLNKELGNVYYFDLYGLRKDKYDILNNWHFYDIHWQELSPKAPMYFFVPKNFELEEEYNGGFAVNELFIENSVGIVTTKDGFLMCDNKQDVSHKINDLINLSDGELRLKYKLKDTRDWSIKATKEDIGQNFDKAKVTPIMYRPFDVKFLYYTGKTNGIVAWPRYRLMRHLLNPSNLGLLVTRQFKAFNEYHHCFISNKIPESCLVSSKTSEISYVFPLYNVGEADSIFENNSELVPNFNVNIYNKVTESLGEKPTPEQLLYYTYAVLHNPSYRERYKEFLKIDFPRIPYPDNKERFKQLYEIGKQIADLHLMIDSNSWDIETTFPVGGNCKVESVSFKENSVWINSEQYFGNVPEKAWTFYIGGYQPAQKWLKDRKGHVLSFDDIRHYQEIIYALNKTNDLMGAIEKLITY